METPSPPHILGECSIQAVADYILAKDVRNILVLTGAGVSVAAGIPDFRSPTTGLYAQLDKYELDDPSEAFSMDLLRENPRIFYTIAKDMDLWPGRYQPTAVHRFVKLLADEGRLLRCCTQNIDGLERAAGLPESLLVEAHGSFATASCIQCKAPYDIQLAKKESDEGRVPLCAECGHIVKPDVVFFGEQLPEAFFDVLIHDTAKTDFVIIIGTSLQVHPFASLPLRVAANTPRVVLNMERVGGGMFRFPSDAVALPISMGSASPPRDVLPSELNGAAPNGGEGSGNPSEADSEATADDLLNDASTSSSDGYAQYGDYSDHPTIGRDAFFPGDCQASITELARCLGLGGRLAESMQQTSE